MYHDQLKNCHINLFKFNSDVRVQKKTSPAFREL